MKRWQLDEKHGLARPSSVHKVEHFTAIPYCEIAGFLTKLRKREAVSACALEFLILTATRLNEAIGARWEEISLADKLWTIPAERMKGRKGKPRAHRFCCLMRRRRC